METGNDSNESEQNGTTSEVNGRDWVPPRGSVCTPQLFPKGMACGDVRLLEGGKAASSVGDAMGQLHYHIDLASLRVFDSL